jgi:hypothetical protein
MPENWSTQQPFALNPPASLGQAAGRDRGSENIQIKTNSYFPVLRSGKWVADGPL